MPMFRYIAETHDKKERAEGEIEAQDLFEARLCMTTWAKTLDVPVRYAITFMVPRTTQESNPCSSTS